MDTRADIHVSGHGYITDIDILEELIRPRYFIPIHGGLSHMMSNALNRKKSPSLSLEKSRRESTQG